MTVLRRSRLVGLIAAFGAATLLLTACGSVAGSADTSSTADASTTDAGAWPRTFENADGTTTEIASQPESILSTSVTVTGTLLAIDAPVTASGAAANGNFFAQWAPVAEERGVQNLWPAGSVDIEAVIAADPDLIVVSLSGADSATDHLAQFQELAPTIVVDYGQPWQDLAVQLGTATGLETQAEATVQAFDEYVADAASRITVPAGSANIISFNGPGENNPIARAGSAQASVLEALGFTIEDPNPEWHQQAELRNDFVWAAYENLTELTAETTFIVSQDDEGAQAFADDPVLANLPSVVAGQVYGLGRNSFRIDYYSATEIVDGVVANFGA